MSGKLEYVKEIFNKKIIKNRYLHLFIFSLCIAVLLSRDCKTDQYQDNDPIYEGSSTYCTYKNIDLLQLFLKGVGLYIFGSIATLILKKDL